jgi:hypothetical protein
MRRSNLPILLFLLAALGAPGFAAAQEGSGDLGWIVTVTPQAGHVTAFEEGAQRHTEVMVDAGVTMTWIAMEIILGPRTGQYVYGSFSLSGADLDAPQGDQEAMQESFAENIDPHTAGAEAQIIRRMVDLGMWTPESPLAPMYEVYRMWVKPGGDAVMRNMFAKLKAAMEQMAPDADYSVWRPAAGSVGSEWTVTVPIQGFASYDEDNPGWMEQMFAQVYGHDEMQLLMDSVAEVILKSTSEVFVIRSDMSVNLPEM